MTCRVCASPADIPLTDKFDDTITIMSAIKTVANISIDESDFYPKYICKICFGELQIAFQFKKKCEASDVIFHKAISSDTTKATNSKPMIMHDIALILHQMKERRLSKPGVKNDRDLLNISLNKSDTKFITPGTVKAEICIQNNQTVDCYEEVNIFDNYREDLNDNCDNLNKSNITNTKKLKNIKRYNLKKSNKCRRCDFKFENKEEFQQHKKKNACIYHPCPECGKLVLNLVSHEKIVHSRLNKYPCHQCGKIYYSSGSLANHMQAHNQTKEYFCDHCPYSAKRKSYLVCHMRVHTGEHRYLCSMCPLKFTNPSNLTKHQLIHFNKKFECNKCKRLFRQKRDLKVHFDAAHLNIRYRCTICGKDLMNRKKLLTHELRVHKREKHKLFTEEIQKIVVGNDYR